MDPVELVVIISLPTFALILTIWACVPSLLDGTPQERRVRKYRKRISKAQRYARRNGIDIRDLP